MRVGIGEDVLDVEYANVSGSSYNNLYKTDTAKYARRGDSAYIW